MLTCTKAMEALKSRGIRVPTVYLDDGHGYDPKTGEATPGKRTPPIPPEGRVVYENQFNSAVVNMVADMLAYHGVRVVFSAPEAADPALNLRVTRVNNDYITTGRPPAAFLSVHYNALNGVFDKKSGGIETFHYTGSTLGEKLARIIHRCVLSGTRQVDRGVKTAGFYVIKYTLMPAALVECGFMDNLVEAGRMLSVPYQLETACELVSGLMEYFGIALTPGVEAAYRAVTISRSFGRHDDSQYWMDVLMGYANIERGRLCTLMER